MKQNQKWTVKSQLWLLSGLLLLNMIGQGAIGVYYSTKLKEKLTLISEVEVPAVKNMTLVDMMHDGLRAIVYKSFYLQANGSDPKDIEEVRGELKDFSTKMKSLIQDLRKLELTPGTLTLLDKVAPETDHYISTTNALVEAIFKQKTDLIPKELTRFTEAFEILEKDYGDLGENIEKDTQAFDDEGKKVSQAAIFMSALALGIGILINLGFSWFTTRRLVSELSTAVKQLYSTSSAVTQSSSQITQESSDLSACATQIASAVQETAASLEEMNSMIKLSADNSEKLKQVVGQGNTSTQSGKQSIDQMIGAVDSIHKNNEFVFEEMNGVSEKITSIVSLINQIGEKTKVINDIVFQTKILSFNASVEAARAGEHGKGFAVVAEEVGKLATMSGTAAQEITEMLNQSMSQANHIVEETKTKLNSVKVQSKDKIDEGLKKAKQCGESFDEITSQIQEISQMTDSIATALVEEKNGIGEITKAVHLFNQSNQQNVAISRKAGEIANHLSSQSNELIALVESLKSLVEKSGTSPTNTPTGWGGPSEVPNEKSTVTPFKKAA